MIRMLEAATSPVDRALVALCGLCGLRVGEAITRAARDLDVAQRELHVVGKGDVTRHVPVGEQAWRWLQTAHSFAAAIGANTVIVPMADTTARDRITSLGLKAGLSRPVASHDLRATFATATYHRSERDIRVVQELLGHASVETTMGYVGVTKANLRRAVG